jgi:multisubunit Na+/H+ antiporter MnhG subunit
MLIVLVLVIGELADPAMQRWWGAHALTTDTVSGLLVLLITVLVVNQLLNLRQARQRGHAVAAQAAIMAAQGARATKAVSSLIDGSGDRGAASDGFQTYMMVLLVGAPVLIGDPVARHFLEQAQYLGGVLGQTLAAIDAAKHGDAVKDDELNDAVKQLQTAAAPLLQLLSPEIRDSIQRVGRTAEE